MPTYTHPSRRMHFFLTFCRQTLCWLCILLFSGLALLNIARTAVVDMSADHFWHELVLYYDDSIFAFCAAAVCMVLFFAALYQLTKRIPVKKLAAIIAVIIFAAGIAWIAISQAGPRADQESVHQIAIHWLNGDFSDFDRGEYLFRYPFQMGYAAFLALLYCIVGIGNYEAVQVINAAVIALIYWGIYQITTLLFGQEEGRFLLLLSLGFWCGWMYSVFVYGNVPSLALAVLAIWLQLRWQRKGGSPLLLAASGICIGFAIVLKNFSLIFLIAQGILLFLHFLRSPRWHILIWILCAVISWQGTFGVLHSWAEHRYGAPLNKGTPMFGWIVMGIQDNAEGWRAPGWYNGYQLYLYEDMGYDEQRMLQRAQEDFENRLQEFAADPLRMGYFFYKKTISQWTDPSAQALWTNCTGNYGNYAPWQLSFFQGQNYSILMHWMNWFQSLTWLCGAVYLFRKRNSLTLEQLLPGLIVLGGFLFQLFWEGKSQYLLPYYMMALPYAACLLQSLCTHCFAWLHTRRCARHPQN